MLLSATHLKKAYRKKGTDTVLAVNDISLQVKEGEILGFLGPNGAGKTTTIKMIAGLVTPDEGDVLIAGESIWNNRSKAITRIGAVLEGSRNLYWRLTPMENLEYWAGLRGISRKIAKARAKDLLEQFKLSHKAKNTIQQLSRGMQQKVAICAALIHQPKLLLLDEPTLGLDLEASDHIQKLVMDLAREERIGVVLTTHHMEVAESLSEHIAIIQNGSIAMTGNTKEVLKQFASQSYIVELASPSSPEQKEQLSTRGVVFESDVIFRLPATLAHEIYTILNLIAPIPIVRVELDTADLATVFRHYTQQKENA